MQHMDFDLHTQATLSSLASRLKTSEAEVLREAVHNLDKDLHQKENVMEMAGISEEDRRQGL